MEIIYPFLITFIMIFIAELGDKTQLLVLSFAGGVKTRNIILGIAIGSFFSHGIAILFGSRIGILENSNIHFIIKIITYASFIIMGILSLLPKKEKIKSDDNKKSSILNKIFPGRADAASLKDTLYSSILSCRDMYDSVAAARSVSFSSRIST